MIERALAALPAGVEQVYLRADSALYAPSPMVYLDRQRVGFAFSVPVSSGLARRLRGLDEASWQLERCDAGALRQWVVLDYLPAGAIPAGGRADLGLPTRQPETPAAKGYPNKQTNHLLGE